MDTKKVGLVIDDYLPRIGGAELYTYNLAKYLKRNGYEVSVFTLDMKNKPSDYFDEFETVRVNISKGVGGKIKFYKELKKFLNNVDIIHVGYCYKFAAYVSIYNFFAKKPFLITLHGRGILDLPGNNFLFSKVHCFYRWLSLKSANKIIASCKDFVDIAKKYTKKEKIIYIPNSVDLDRFAFGDGELQGIPEYKDKKVVMAVRRLVPKNGIQFLVESAKYIIKKNPDVLFSIVGYGHMEKILKNRVKELGVEKYFDFVGRVENSVVPQYLYSANVIVFPSTAESTSIACLEAMSMKKAIVASSVGGFPEMIVNNESGFLVKLVDWDVSNYDAPKDITDERKKEFAGKISILLSDVDKREFFGEKSFERVKNIFSWDVTVRQIINEYNLLLGGNKEEYRKFSDKIIDKRFKSKNKLRRHAHLAQYEAVVNKVLPGETVLDAGCGEGVLSCLLAKKGINVVGIDISESNVEAAKKLAKEWGVEDKVKFEVGDAENLQFPDESFDVVVSSHVLEHVPNYYKGLSEIHRVTRGKAVIAMPTILNLCSIIQAGHGSFWERSKRSLLALPWGFLKTMLFIFGEGVNEGYVGRKDLVHIWRYPWVMRRQIRKAGFEINSFEASSICLPFFEGLLPVVELLDKYKKKPFLNNFGYGSTVVVNKKV